MNDRARALVEDNIRLVYYVFRKMAKGGVFAVYRDDIISEGMVGLVKAANSFDENRGVKFSSYAIKCIRNAMLMGLRKLRKLFACEISLNTPIGIDEEGKELQLTDVLEASQRRYAEERLDFRAFMQKATDKDRKIVCAKAKGYTQKEIAGRLGISQSYVARRFQRLRLRFSDEENRT